jgi:hypothetical protein
MVNKQRPLDRVETVSLSNELGRTDSDDDGNRLRLTHGKVRWSAIQWISQKSLLFETR